MFSLSVDIDECLLDLDVLCDENADCSNTIGSYDCSCITGYSGDGFTCTSKILHFLINIITMILNDPYLFYTDIDECTVGPNNCSIYASCLDRPGSFDCVCNEGFSGDGVDCSSKWFFYFNTYFCVLLR